ncbi:MAG: hypothetical protein KAV87_24020 [Desulfobacteraceae bacterium]|nr:hypothetical protein [Desulfobacteraceae bacterium]
MSKVIDLAGKKFGRLTVLEYAGIRPDGSALWQARCDCGTLRIVGSYSLRSGRTKSCGCLQKERVREAMNGNSWGKTHGLSANPLHRVLRGMKARCYNKNAINYERYGGRGITVCNEWRTNSILFIQWATVAGWKKGLQIDRIDNNGNYEPSNCQFVTPKVNSQNRRSTVLINTGTFIGTLGEIAEMIGIKRHVLDKRINILDWPIEKALTTPVRNFNFPYATMQDNDESMAI